MNDKVPHEVTEQFRISNAQLRWQCTKAWLPFATTAEVEPIQGVVGQDDAMDALRFGLQIDAPGQNIFVRGLTGTGRATLLEHVLRDITPPCAPTADRCYVHNFDKSDTPKLLSVPRGKGIRFAQQVDSFCEFVKQQLAPALASDTVRARRSQLDEQAQAGIRELGKPFEEELRANELAMVPVQVGQTMQPAIVPLVNGEPVTLEQFEQLTKEAGNESKIEETHRKISDFARRLDDLNQKIREVQIKYSDAMQMLYQEEARRIIAPHVKVIHDEFSEPGVKDFLQAVVEDLVTRRLQVLGEDTTFTRLYRVNPVLCRPAKTDCPVIRDNAPSVQTLLGHIDREVSPNGAFRSDHMMIHAGSLLSADGGYLLLEARDVLGEAGAWPILLRTLKSGQLNIVPSELSHLWSGPLLKPEPIPLSVKVVLVGDAGFYELLDRNDPDFSQLFKVLADFETTIERDQIGVGYYAGVLAKLAKEEDLLHFDQDGTMAMTEHGARIAGQKNKLTTRFGRLADIAREANYVAKEAGLTVIGQAQVHAAIRRGRRRADLPARNYRKRIADGTIRIQTSGSRVGQINGLAVMQAGPLIYGFPSRITASVGPGSDGTINIEREAQLSGAIHTKGFYILGGLLRNLLRTPHPLTFSASIAFEQSYGGIDGDSASGAEIVCLLSALTNVPLRQELAMTGAIDQLGNIQPIGGVSEKVEGFYEVCREVGLTGQQGVIIPSTNTGDLMLNPETLEACNSGQFHVYAVDTVQQALQLFTNCEPGVANAQGEYPEGSLLNIAMRRSREYWDMVSGSLGVGAKSRTES